MESQMVTVFGGSGFVGRHLVQHLARRGHRVRVAVRDPEGALFLKPMGVVGQVTPFYADIKDRASVDAAVAGADWVVNLVGVLYESGAQKFAAIHRDGARTVAEAARAAGVRRLVQMSALGVAQDSPAVYGRTKAEGEAAVAEAFAGASFTRPSVIFGPEDNLFNQFAAMSLVSPFLPLIGGGRTRFQPVYVGDVAEGICRILERPDAEGRTYEMGGPRVVSFKELLELMMTVTGRRRRLVSLPFGLARLQASVLQLLPRPPLTVDQIRLLQQDNVLSGTVPGLEALDIAPTAMEVVLPTYLDRFRAGGRKARNQPA